MGNGPFLSMGKIRGRGEDYDLGMARGRKIHVPDLGGCKSPRALYVTANPMMGQPSDRPVLCM